MPLWIAIFAPHLALQATAVGALADVPVAMTEPAGSSAVVYRANRAALALGVAPGLSASAARALCEDVVLLPRNIDRERQALSQLATAALPFTPAVSLDADAVVLEVATSLRLFGGLKRLGQRLKQAVTTTALTVVYAIAPTPRAAWLIAKARATGRSVASARHIHHLPPVLDALPINLFDWPVATHAALTTLGIHTLADMARLPRDGVRQRWGAVLKDVDCAYGQRPDPRHHYTAPEHFSGSVGFVLPTDDIEQLLHAMTQLWQGFARFLQVRGLAANRQQWQLQHGRSSEPTSLAIATQEATRDIARWQKISRELLQKKPLAGAVYEVSFASADVVPYQAVNASLLPGYAQTVTQLAAVIETISARLGAESVVQIAVKQDHRPELASDTTASAKADANVATRRVNTPARTAVGRVAEAAAPPSPTSTPLQPRPVWLLPKPRALLMQHDWPIWQGTLTFVAGPERIETGWWDGAPMRRDYFVARNPHGETVWIYQNLQDQRWFLHGFFA